MSSTISTFASKNASNDGNLSDRAEESQEYKCEHCHVETPPSPFHMVMMKMRGNDARVCLDCIQDVDLEEEAYNRENANKDEDNNQNRNC